VTDPAGKKRKSQSDTAGRLTIVFEPDISYDPLARLSTAVTTGSVNYPQWGLSMTYDRYGNRTDQNQTAGSPPMNHVTIDATSNRITGSPYAYDGNGNITNDGNNTLVYDGENRATSATNGGSSGTYTYDGNGLRIKKVVGSTTTVYIFSGSKVIAEYDNAAPPSAPVLPQLELEKAFFR